MKIFFGLLAAVGIALWVLERYYRSRSAPAPSSSTAPATDNLYDIAARVEPFFDQIVLPSELLEHPVFCEGVALLRGRNCSVQELLSYYHGSNRIIACIALEVLCTHDDRSTAVQAVLDGLRDSVLKQRYFELRMLESCTGEVLIGRALLASSADYLDKPQYNILREFVERRVAAGEPLALGELPPISSNEQAALLTLIAALGDELAEPLKQELEQRTNATVDVAFLRSVGRVWNEATEGADSVVEHPALLRAVHVLEETLLREPPRSVVLIGEPGVGKTSLLQIFGKRMQERGWTIFESGASELVAGQSYIGQLEMRVGELLQRLGRGKKVVWVIPEFHTLLWAGRHQYQPSGVIDQILPAIESGELKIVGVTYPGGFEQLLRLQPRVRTALEALRLQPLDRAGTLALAAAWAARHREQGQVLIEEETIAEVFQLATQYVGEKAAPGNLLHLLESTRQRRALSDTEPIPLSVDDVIVTLTQMTGLPASILDDRQGIDLHALQEFFRQRVFGQEEAVECLVERVAMIKAGLTDPTRPQGVFLFAGPTGTGKTEIAKALAEFLFGSQDRMIRLDMSEFQTPESLSRLLGDYGELREGTALVHQIRNRPFSIVLLDEFEKAHQNIWDIFLQVFDDGRLTDRQGNTADFRHCIIILTSNLGATISRGPGLGFASDAPQFTPTSVEKAIETVFRKEFINRIDRVVVFRPLSRSTMKSLLRKELNAVLSRRGLRNRTWVVEWDDSAVEFLLVQGFTPDLGARPLKRAIERYVLAPLSMTIVNHQFPEGEQFLFVRSDGRRIAVEFIDPGVSEEPTADAGDGSLTLQSLMRQPQCTGSACAFLQEHCTRIAARVGDEDWSAQKQELLERASHQEVWNADDRFMLLGRAEYMDRIEVGVDTALSLLRRCSESREQAPDRALACIERLAMQLYLLETACGDVEQERPHDAFIVIEGSAGVPDAVALLSGMYSRWAARRGMQFVPLEEQTGPTTRLLFAVSGYGAYTLLKAEEGVHAFEYRERDADVRRSNARVYILPQPEGQPYGTQGLHQAAAALLEGLASDPTQPAIVRRYRLGDSPLVRDSRRQGKTGRLDRVLDGDFDILF